MPLTLPDLPYDHAALEPHIDARTMEIHHGKHHQAYVDNANKALDGTEWADRASRQLIATRVIPEDIRTAVRNNVGGHANHSLFWTIMGPDGGGEPEGDLAAAINDTFGSADELKSAINDGGVKRFGSGWTWLVHDGTGLAVYSTANQDSPIMQATRRCSASMSGSTPITSTTRTGVPITSPPGGTSSTGPRSGDGLAKRPRPRQRYG